MGITLVVAAATILSTAAADALVNLEWRPLQQSVTVGSPVAIALYAVSDSAVPQLISAMDVIVEWDPAYLQYVQLGDPQPYWLADGFFDGSPDDLNENLQDGSAMYTAWANLGESVAVPQEGLLCVEFEFLALASTSSTLVRILPTFGQVAMTQVLDGTSPNLDVKGTLGSADVAIVPEPSSFAALVLSMGAAMARHRRRRPCRHHLASDS